MGHYAQVGKNGNIIRVIVADQEFINSGAVGDPKEWVETAKDGSIRKNYAGKNCTYDKERDAFIPPKKYSNWVLDEKTVKWVPPKERPREVPEGKRADWDDRNNDWVVVDNSAVP